MTDIHENSNPATWDPALDAVVAAPKHHRVIFENERLRVLEPGLRVRPVGDSFGARWGRRPEQITDEHAWLLEAEYLALGLVNVICALSPQRIIVGGGVMNEPSLLPLVRSRVHALASGYFDAPELGESIDDYIVRPTLGDRAGVLGALELARGAVTR